MSDRSQTAESQIKELKVSGHTMALEPGLYCVYNAPGGPVANETGLPGVRITPAPAMSQNKGRGQIAVSTFAGDGWIGTDSAALVQVTKGPAELLVTVYQATDSGTDAPKLQVVLLSGPAAAKDKPAAVSVTPQIAEAQSAEPPAEPQSPGSVEVVAHVYGHGDLAGKLGDWMGSPGSQRWIEGFGIAAAAGVAAGDIEYQAVLGRGWLSPWSEGGNFCGSRGMSLPILGLRVRLRGDAAKTHRVALSASFVDGTRIGPVRDGEACEAPSLAALEAFQVSFEPLAGAAVPAEKPRGRKAAASPEPAMPENTAKPTKRGSKAAAQPVQAVKAEPVKAAIKAAPIKPSAKAPAKTAAKAVAAPPPASAGKNRTAAKATDGKATAKPQPKAALPVPPAKPAARANKRTPATTRRR